MRQFFSIFLVLFLSACSTPAILENKTISSQSAVILLKSDKLKFNDTGFINIKEDGTTQAKIFTAGVEVLKMDFNSHICLNDICYSQEAFNKEYLSEYYPKDILKNIFNGEEILNSQNIKRYNDYYTQEIVKVDYNIFYKVSKNEIYFKDIKNKILIKISKI